MSDNDEDIVLTDEWLDPDNLIFPDGVGGDDDEDDHGPEYSVAQVAEFFFARSSHWMRWQEKKHALHYVNHDGEREELQPNRTNANARKYDLALVEKIAHGLAQQGRIDAQQLIHTLNLVRIQAEMHNVLPRSHSLLTLGENGPTYEIKAVSEFFFNRSPDWLALQEKDIRVDSGETIAEVTPRTKRHGQNVRYYDLALIQRIANALVDSGRITRAQYDTAISLIDIKAEQHSLVQADPDEEKIEV